MYYICIYICTILLYCICTYYIHAYIYAFTIYNQYICAFIIYVHIHIWNPVRATSWHVDWSWWLPLWQVFYRYPQLHWAHECTGRSCAEDAISQQPSPCSGFYILAPCSCLMFPEPGDSWHRCPFRAPHSINSHFLSPSVSPSCCISCCRGCCYHFFKGIYGSQMFCLLMSPH